MPVFGLSRKLKSRYRHFLWTLVFLFCFFLGSAQQPPSLKDSLGFLLKTTPKFAAGFNTRGSFIDSRIANVREVTVGANFKDRLTIGIGYHWLKTERNKEVVLVNQLINTQLKMRYYSLNVMYTFYQKDKWYFSLPVEFGLGKSFREGEGKKKYFSESIMLYEPVMLAEYRIFKYFGIAGGIGFRLMLKNNKSLDEQFSSPIYVARLKIRFSDIYNDLK